MSLKTKNNSQTRVPDKARRHNQRDFSDRAYTLVKGKGLFSAVR